jgi:hypothetical protein
VGIERLYGSSHVDTQSAVDSSADGCNGQERINGLLAMLNNRMIGNFVRRSQNLKQSV